MMARPRLDGIRHANGFTVYHLSQGLRLHVWDDATPFGDVHSHRWSLESRVLMGDLLIAEYREVPGDGHARYDYGDHDDLTLSGRADLEQTGQRVVRAGETHACGLGQLHAVRALAPTVTLFHYGPDGATPVVYDPTREGSAVMNGLTITDEETGEHLAGPAPCDQRLAGPAVYELGTVLTLDLTVADVGAVLELLAEHGYQVDVGLSRRTP